MPDSTMKTRRRSRDYGKSWSLRFTRSSKTEPWILASSADMTLKGTQITESEGHPFQGHYGKSDQGGSFTTGKMVSAGYAGPIIACESADGLEKIEGSMRHPNAPSGTTKQAQEKFLIPEPGFATANSDLLEKGATAVALCSPANPLMKLTDTLAETFREGLPSLPGVQTWRKRSKDELHRKLSGEYLNVTFGALPLLSEIGEVADLLSHFASTIEQYKRDEGRLVRRQFHFDVERSSTSRLVGTGQSIRIGPTSLNYFNSDGTVPRVDTYIQETTERKCWFSGAFRYHIPDSIIGHIIGLVPGSTEFSEKLIGNSLTPELLWELAPWSWAVDYFSNAQQVIQNLTNMELYGLFMAYGYVMDETIRNVTYTSKPSAGSPRGPSCPSYSFTEVSKVRRKANPYGFGVSWSDLSPLQVANLAAAGISQLL